MKRVVFEKWQIKKLLAWFLGFVIIGGGYICYTTYTLYRDKSAEEYYWQKNMLDREAEAIGAQQVGAETTRVFTGTYLESVKEVALRSSYYRVVCSIWFRWKGDDDLDMVNNFHIYNGTTNKLEVMEDTMINGWHYQRCRLDVTVNNDFWTVRFPLESHQMRFYIEPNMPAKRVTLEKDGDNSSYNPNIGIPGFYIVRHDTAEFTQVYDTSYGKNSDDEITSEFMTQLEINRSGLGLYAKCFIALFGTSLWVFITMFLCTYHRVDPLSMIPAALFGTVSNIMVGANLLPDALEIGLLEYVNAWGIFTIIAGALTIININRIRNKHGDNRFAALFGRVMSFTLMFIVILGHILMPLSAYMATV